MWARTILLPGIDTSRLTESDSSDLKSRLSSPAAINTLFSFCSHSSIPLGVMMIIVLAVYWYIILGAALHIFQTFSPPVLYVHHHLCQFLLPQLKFHDYRLNQDGWHDFSLQILKLAYSIIFVINGFLKANMYFIRSYLDPPMQPSLYNPSIHQRDSLRPLPGQWVPCGSFGRGGSAW